jgi:hypothetical protein
MVNGWLIGLPVSTLQAIVDQCTQTLINGFVRGTSYTIAGRAHTFSSPAEIAGMINEANLAIGLQTGARSFNVRANFNPSLGRGRGCGGPYNPAIGF